MLSFDILTNWWGCPPLTAWVYCTRSRVTGCAALIPADSRNLLSQPAYFLFKFLVVVAAIRKNRAQARVKFSRSCLLRNSLDIAGGDSRAWDNHDSLLRCFDKSGQHGSALLRGLCAARS